MDVVLLEVLGAALLEVLGAVLLEVPCSEFIDVLVKCSYKC